MKTATWRIAVLSAMALALGAYLTGCGGDGAIDSGTVLDVTGSNDNLAGGLNVHLWATEGPAQATAQVSPEAMPGAPIAPGGSRVLLNKRYFADADGNRGLPQYITVHAGRNDVTLGTKRVNLPAQSFDDERWTLPKNVVVDVRYTDGVAGPVWTVDVSMD